MQYFLIIDLIKQNQFLVIWTPGQIMLQNIIRPHIINKSNHTTVSYKQFPLSSQEPFLPSVMQGYVDNLRNGYHCHM